MGCGDKNADKKKRKKDRSTVVNAENNNDRHNREPPMAEASDHGISVDPATLLDVAGWKIPPLPPGLVSISNFFSYLFYS